MSTNEDPHKSINDLQDWLNAHHGDPTFAKIYLRAFDNKVLNYYTRRFDEKSVYEYLREYVRNREQYRLKGYEYDMKIHPTHEFF